MSAVHSLQFLALASVGEWLTTLSLIFGGCCSNALALELITTQYPPAGTLITFTQFLLVALASLRNQLVYRPRPVARHEAVGAIARLLSERRSSLPHANPCNVAVVGPDEDVAELAQEVANSLRRAQIATSVTDDYPKNEGDGSFANGAYSGTVVIGEAPASSSLHHRKGTDLATVVPRSQRSVPVEAPIIHEDTEKSACPDGNRSLHAKLNAVVLHCGTVVTPEKRDFTIHIAKSAPSYSNNSTTLDLSSPAHPIVLHPLPPIRSRLLHPYRYRLRTRSIPIARYAIQVFLFVLVSLLNNAAFAYHVPMAVHIIFRSGGLVVNMLLGWLLYRRRYTTTQTVSILVVTLGVLLTTLSSTHAKRRPPSPAGTSASASHISSSSFSPASVPIKTYLTGIALLTLALLLSGLLGLQQDATFAKYGRDHWAEALFYLHALALPLFTLAGPRMASEAQAIRLHAATAGPQFQLPFPSLPIPLLSPPLPVLDYKHQRPNLALALSIPAFYAPLLLNAVTQLLCVAGVNRLTARVSSLTVTLVLVVRKAASLAISVLLLNGGAGKDSKLLWSGAAAVLAGTMGYAFGTTPRRSQSAREGTKKRD